MLDAIECLSRQVAEEVLLPYRVLPNEKALLRANGKTLSYRGPMLVQRKAVIIGEGVSLAAFDWTELVEAVYRLWRHGVGCHLLYPWHWALFRGHLRLADTSALTTDFGLVHRRLSKENLDVVQMKLRRRFRQSGLSKHVEDYLRFVRARINQAHLSRHWRKDVVDCEDRGQAHA
jgi:hypothetical protein